MNKEIKEEADRIFLIYFHLIPSSIDYKQHRLLCLQCAIKCVDEILKVDPINPAAGIDAYRYWSDVKKELESRL